MEAQDWNLTYFVGVGGDDHDEPRRETGQDVAVPEPPVRKDLAVPCLLYDTQNIRSGAKGYQPRDFTVTLDEPRTASRKMARTAVFASLNRKSARCSRPK